jgi:protein-S-isoprenylcysteine O-methyltransferase Ste14
MTDLLIRWGPLMVMLLSALTHFAQPFWPRRTVPEEAFAPSSSAREFVRDIFRRALGVIVVYFLYRAVFPELEVDFGRIDWLALEAVQLSGLGISLLAALWLLMAQVLMAEHWDLDVPPWMAQAAPFTFSRNPVLLGVIAEALGLFLASPTALMLMALTAVWLGAQLQVRLEEDALRANYGTEYIAYCKRVRRWL